MHDLPTAPDLLALARDVLLNDLLPRLPPESRLDARLVASSMAIAEREVMAGDEAAQQIFRGLESFYAATTLTHPALRAGSPLSHIAGEGAERSEAGEDYQDLLPRLACDLRVGKFEQSAALERGARDILWRLTIGRLRRANPRFLVANGFS
jgi:hypothetical protein